MSVAPGKLTVTLAGALALAAAVHAHGNATGVVKERMDLMERYEELIERVFAMLHGELPYSADVVRNAAVEIRGASGDHLLRLFPAGSDDDPSEASPAIWQKPGMFAHMAGNLGWFASALDAVADGERGAVAELPLKWEDVPAMGETTRRRGMMMGGGMMGRPGDLSVAEAAWGLAHTCNSCHAFYREEDEEEG